MRIYFISLVCLLLSACAGITGGKDNAPAPTELHAIKAKHTFNKLWRSSTGKGIGKDYIKLVIASNEQGQIFTADSKGVVSSFKGSKGKRLWRTNTKHTVTGGPAANKEWVAVGTADAKLIVLNAATGKIQWQQEVSNEILAAPVFYKNKVIVKTIDGKLYAFVVDTGQQEWLYDHGAPSLILRGSSAPVVSNDRLYTGFADGKLACLDATNGDLIWQSVMAIPKGGTELEAMVDIDSDPVIVGDAAYVVTYQGNVLSVKTESGHVNWLKDFSSYRNIAVARRAIYATDVEGNVWAFSKRTGDVLWQQSGLRYRGVTGPIVYNNMVVVADNQGYLHGLAVRSGELIARETVAGPVATTPKVIGNELLVLSRNGKLTAYQTERGH